MAEKQKTFTSDITGKEYVFQKVTPVAWLDAMDDVEEHKGRKRRKLYAYVLENIVVQPKMKLDDFEESNELEEVVKAAIDFQSGK